MRNRIKFAICVVGLGLWATVASAQWATQTLSLRAGWTAVFLEVQPNPADCDTVFSGLPVESVWAWNSRFSTVQYISDPNSLLPGQPDWLTWVPAGSTNRVSANLFNLQGGRAYLIKATTATMLTVR